MFTLKILREKSLVPFENRTPSNINEKIKFKHLTLTNVKRYAKIVHGFVTLMLPRKE